MQLFCRARPARPYHPWPTRVRAAVAVLIIVSGVLLALAILAASERFHELPGDSYHARLEAAASAGGTLYGVLGVPPDASAGDVRGAYHRLARERHPDRVGARGGTRDEAAAALEELLRLREAYEVLADGVRRCKYDSRIGNLGYVWYERCRRLAR